MSNHHLIFTDAEGEEVELLVSGFEKNDLLSDMYEIKVSAYADYEADIPLNVPVILKFDSSAGVRTYSGVIMRTCIDYDGSFPNHPFRYEVTIKPPFAISHLSNARVAYRSQSAVAIIDDTLQRIYTGAKVGSYDLSRVRDKYKNKVFDRVDINLAPDLYDYLHFQMNLGLFYYFEQTGGDHTQVFVSDCHGMNYRSPSPLIFNGSRAISKDPDTQVLKSIAPMSMSSPVQSKTRYFDQTVPNQSQSQLMSGQGEIYAQDVFYVLEDQEETQDRLAIAKNSLNQQLEVTGRFGFLDAGMRVEVEDQSPGGQAEHSGEYFVYRSKTEGQYDAKQKRWSFESKASLIPYQQNKRWYPPFYQHAPLPSTIPYTELQSISQIDDQGRRAIKLNNSHLDKSNTPALYLREVQQTSTKGGGAAQSSRLSSEMVIALTNGICYDPIILGSIPNSKVNEYVNLDNAHITGTSTDGGLGLNFHRKRLGNDYGNVTFTAINKAEQESKVELGGVKEIDPETQEEVAHRGIRLQSTALAKFVTANNVTKEVGGNTYQFHFHQATDESPLNTITEKGNIELYHIAYWTQPLASNPTQEPRPYVARLQVSHLPSPGQLPSQGNKRLQTQINWLTQPQSAKPQFASIEITPKSDASKKETLPLSPSQRSIQITTTANEEYDVIIQSSYPVAQDDQGNQQDNYVDQIKFSFTSSLAIEQVTLSNIKPMLDPKTQWRANLSWQLGGDYGKDLQSYQLSSGQIGSASLNQTSVEIDELDGQTPYDINIQAQLTTGADQEVDFSFTLAKLTDEQGQQQEPEIGFERTADQDGITDTHNLATKYLFVSHAQQRIPNPPEGHAHDFEQKALGLETFLSHTQVEFIQSESKYNYALDPNYDEIEQNAKDRALETKSKLIRTHKGNSTIDHQGSVDIDSQSNSYSKTYQAKEVKYSNELGYHLSREGISFNYQGTDLIYYAPFASRTIKNATYSAGKQFIINASYIGIKTGDAEIECDEYETGVQLGISKGDQVIKCQTANFGDGMPSMSMNFKLPELASSEAPAAGAVDEGEQSETKEVINAGLQTVKVVPKWRKVLNDLDDIENFSALLRTTPATQNLVLNSLAEYYIADSAEQDKKIHVPDKLEKWSDAIKKGYQNKIDALETEINNIQKQIDDNLTPNYAQLKGAPLQSDTAIAANNKLRDKKALLEKERSNIQNQVIGETIDGIKALIHEQCLPANAQNLRSGFIYIFLKDSQVEVDNQAIYDKAHLFKEYQIIAESDRYQFAEIDLGGQAGLDVREASSDSKDYIELPAVWVKQDSIKFDDNNICALNEVYVFYSPLQLSWPRVHQYGGLSPQDARAVKSAEQPNQAEILKKLQSKTVDIKLSQRTKAQGGQHLKELWQQCYEQNWIVDQTVYKEITAGIWQNLFGFNLNNSSMPYVLLDDVSGLLFEQISQVLSTQSQLSEMVNAILPKQAADQQGNKDIVIDQAKIDQAEEMKTALLAWQTFFNPKAMGLIKINGLLCREQGVFSGNRTSNMPLELEQQFKVQDERYQSIMKGQADLDKSKLLYTLRQHSRKFFKVLMQAQQQSAYKLLQQPQFKEIWADHFSVGIADYLSCHTRFWGMVQPLCIDPYSLDADLGAEVFPPDAIDTIDIDGDNTGSSLASSYTFKGYTETRFTQEGYQLYKTVTKFKYDAKKDCVVRDGKPDKQPYAKLPQPIGYDYLDQAMLAEGADLGLMLFPDETKPDFSQTVANNETYLKGLGQYNGTLLGQGQDILSWLLDSDENILDKLFNSMTYGETFDVLGNVLDETNQADQNLADKKLDNYITDNIKSFRKNMLKKGIASIHEFLDSLITTLQKRPYWSDDTLLKKTHRILCDAYQQYRNTLEIKEKPTHAKSIGLLQYRVTAPKRQYLKWVSDLDSELSDKGYAYRLSGGEVVQGYAQAKQALQQSYHQSIVLLENIRDPQGQGSHPKLTYINGESAYMQAYQQPTFNADQPQDTNNSRRLRGFNRALQGVYATYCAMNDLTAVKATFNQDSQKGGNKVIDVITALSHLTVSVGTALSQALESTNLVAKGIAKITNRTDAYRDFVQALGYKEIDGKLVNTYLRNRQLANKLTDYLNNRDTSIRTALGNVDALTYLGIVVSGLDTLQSSIKWYQSQGQNDPAVAASNFLDMLSKGFYAASAISQASKKALGKQVGKNIIAASTDSLFAVSADVGDVAVEKVGTSMLERGSLMVVGELASAFIPVVDVLSLIAFVCQIGSIILSLFRDNVYQSWAKGSRFVLGNQQGHFKTIQDEYGALLNLVTSPSLQLSYAAIPADNKDKSKDAKTSLVDQHQLKSQVAIPNLQFKNLVPKYGVYIVTKARLVTNTLVTQDTQGQHYYDQYSQFVIAYPLKRYTLPMYDTQAHSLVGFEVSLSQSTLTNQVKDFIIAIAKYMYDHYQNFESVAWLGERQPYSTMDKAIDQVIDGINKVEGSLMPWSTNKLFGIYAQGRIEDGNIILPNSYIDQVRETQPDDVDENKQAFDKLLQGDRTYVSQLLHTDILGHDSVSSIKSNLKAYWQTNPQVNAIIISKGE